MSSKSGRLFVGRHPQRVAGRFEINGAGHRHSDERERRAVAALYERDRQVRDARPDALVTEALARPGMSVAESIMTVIACNAHPCRREGGSRTRSAQCVRQTFTAGCPP
jgi:hypothetical protein